MIYKFVGFVFVQLWAFQVIGAPLSGLSLQGAQTVALAAAPSILSFKEWKVSKVSEAKTKYSKLETEYLTKKNTNPRDRNLKLIYSDLRSYKAHIDEASELSVSDYFVGYLSKVRDQKKAFKLAAEKLDSSEVAELMTAYADSLLETSGEGISTLSPGTATEASK